MQRQVEGVIQLNKDNFVVVKIYKTEYRINNWYGTRKQFNISKRDLPLKCKGVISKFSSKFFGTKYKTRNFTVVSIEQQVDQK